MTCTLVAKSQDNQLGKTEKLEWKVFRDEQYVPFDADEDAGVKTIYFELDFIKHQGKTLHIDSRQHPSIFIEGELFLNGTSEAIHLNTDSVGILFRKPLVWVAVHQQNINPLSLHTFILSSEKTAPVTEPVLRPETYFRDFVIVSLVILLVLLVLMLYINPKLAADYFSVLRLFSRYESEESQMTNRTMNSANILFYFFTAMMLALLLKIVFHFGETEIVAAWYFNGASFGGEMVEWFQLSVMLLLFFLVKMILIFVFARLFDLREITRTHIFNWIKLMLLLVSPIMIFTLGYYLLLGQRVSVYLIMIDMLCWILIGMAIIIFSKVARRSSLTLFHIFSYLCATEIIPILISIKLIYN